MSSRPFCQTGLAYLENKLLVNPTDKNQVAGKEGLKSLSSPASPSSFHSQKPLANTGSISQPTRSHSLLNIVFFWAVASYFSLSKSSHHHWQWRGGEKYQPNKTPHTLLGTHYTSCQMSQPQAGRSGRAHSVKHFSWPPFLVETTTAACPALSLLAGGSLASSERFLKMKTSVQCFSISMQNN